MAIIVIEQGRPDGTDFVMGEHHSNRLSQAKKAGQQIVKVLDLGDEYALASIQLVPVFDEQKENLCVLVVAMAGLNSRIAGLQMVPTVMGEIARMPVAELKAGIAKALQPPEQA